MSACGTVSPMTDREPHDRDPTEPPPGAAKKKERKPPLIRTAASLPADLDYKLRLATARRGSREVDVVREALAAHLGVELEPPPRKPLSLPTELVDSLSELAASRGLTPDRLAAELLTDALDDPVEPTGGAEVDDGA